MGFSVFLLHKVVVWVLKTWSKAHKSYMNCVYGVILELESPSPHLLSLYLSVVKIFFKKCPFLFFKKHIAGLEQHEGE